MTQTTDTQQEELEDYSFQELLDLNSKVQEQLHKRQAQELGSHKEKTLQLARALGISIEEMFGLHQPRKKGTRKPRADKDQPVAPKYRGPNGELWSGKGPPPKWMKPLLEQGHMKEDYLIEKEAA